MKFQFNMYICVRLSKNDQTEKFSEQDIKQQSINQLYNSVLINVVLSYWYSQSINFL